MTITRFEGQYALFSNFYPSTLLWMGRIFSAVEQPYQASKHPNPEEPDPMKQLQPKDMAKLHSRILNATGKDFRNMPVLDIFAALTPGQAKRLGHSMGKRPDCDTVCPAIMFALVLQKYQMQPFTDLLLSTGSSMIEEGNTWDDTTWGICPPGSGIGENRLGRLLMATRQLIATRTAPKAPTTIAEATSARFMRLTHQALAQYPAA